MTSVTGSPSKGRNSFIDRYMASLGNESTTEAKPISPIKLNVSLGSPNRNKGSNKENNTGVKLEKPYSPRQVPSNPLKPLSFSEQNVEKHSQRYVSGPESAFMKLNVVESSDKPFDTKRLSSRDLKYYEFLCRVKEAKRWIEAIIGETIDSEMELAMGNGLRNGVYLAKLTQKINPNLVRKIVPAGNSLQFVHTQNINSFFHLVESVGVPDLFRFELTDLYEKKNIPKVFETLHALASVINSKWPGRVPEIQDLTGLCSFSNEDIATCQRKLPTIHNFRSFKTSKTSGSPSLSTEPAPVGLLQDVEPISTSDLSHTAPLPTTPTRAQDSRSAKRSIEKALSPADGSPHFDEVDPSLDEQKSPADDRASLPEYHSPLSRDEKRLNSAKLLADTVPVLKFDSTSSPAKSLSYYSPRIYRHLSYRTNAPDFSPTRLPESRYDVDYYDTMKYATPEYSPLRKKRMTEFQFLDSVCSLQAICRGVNTRFGLTLRQRKVDMVIKKLIVFQARARASSVRKALKEKFDSEVVTACSPLLCGIQAIIRGNIIRERVLRLRVRLLHFEDRITSLQAICRAIVIARACKATLESHATINHPLQGFQAHIRGYQKRKSFKELNQDLTRILPQIITLQGLLRSHHLRKHRKSIYFSLNEQMNRLVTMQALSRSIIVRGTINSLQEELRAHSSTIFNLSAILKGSFKRTSVKSLATAVRDSKDPVVSLQALSRGVLARFALELIADIVESNNLVNVQSMARGFIIRRAHNERARFFRRNVIKVVKVQSFVRSYQLRSAYLEFMSSANPSLWSVKKFVPLLNRIHTSHQSQTKLERVKSQIDQSNKTRDKLQDRYKQLKTKCDVLHEYGIIVSNSPEKSKAFQESISSAFPCYEKILYLLQTDPFYWKTLSRLEPSFASKYLTKTFVSANGTMGKRESAFFIKLITDFMVSDIEGSNNVQEFLSSTTKTFWQDLFMFYIQRQIPGIMVQLFKPVLDFISSEQVDFESIPAIIFKKIHPHAMDLSSSESIEDEETKKAFVKNLTSLWKAVELMSEALTKNTDIITEEIKFLCTAAYRAVADRSPHESDALLAISKVLIEIIASSFFRDPVMFGLKRLSPQADKKVSIFLDVLITVFSFSEFQGYLTPLNQYSEQVSSDLAVSLKRMLTSPSFENYCDRLVYIDMCQESRASLNIPKQYLIDMGVKLKSNLNSFPHDDPITHVLDTMVKTKETDSLQSSSKNLVDLRLNPSAYQLSSNNDRLTSIYNEIKRGLIYMMQVEDVDTNLYDLMTSSILDEDEPVFQRLVQKTDAIRNDPLLKNLDTLSYFNLKQHVLERAYELKQMDNLPLQGGLQGILNDIANTIKSREYVVTSAASEVQTAECTLGKIHDSNNQLQDAARLLEGSLKKAVKLAQKSNQYVPVKKHGLSNKLKDVYKKVNHRSNGERNCLTLDWPTRQLYEAGVLKEIAGENLGKVALSFFGSGGPKYPEITFKISTSDGEVYAVEMVDERKGDRKTRSSRTDSFEFSKLLDLQAQNENAKLDLFSKKVDFDVTKLMALVATSYLKTRHM